MILIITIIDGVATRMESWEHLYLLSTYQVVGTVLCILLGGAKGLFMFFHNILQKNLNELFGHPSTYINLVNNNKTYLIWLFPLCKWGNQASKGLRTCQCHSASDAKPEFELGM